MPKSKGGSDGLDEGGRTGAGDDVRAAEQPKLLQSETADSTFRVADAYEHTFYG